MYSSLLFLQQNEIFHLLHSSMMIIVKAEIGKIMSTAEIMKKARDEGVLSERECEIAIEAWAATVSP